MNPIFRSSSNSKSKDASGVYESWLGEHLDLKHFGRKDSSRDFPAEPRRRQRRVTQLAEEKTANSSRLRESGLASMCLAVRNILWDGFSHDNEFKHDEFKSLMSKMREPQSLFEDLSYLREMEAEKEEPCYYLHGSLKELEQEIVRLRSRLFDELLYKLELYPFEDSLSLRNLFRDLLGGYCLFLKRTTTLSLIHKQSIVENEHHKQFLNGVVKYIHEFLRCELQQSDSLPCLGNPIIGEVLNMINCLLTLRNATTAENQETVSPPLQGRNSPKPTPNLPNELVSLSIVIYLSHGLCPRA